MSSRGGSFYIQRRDLLCALYLVIARRVIYDPTKRSGFSSFDHTHDPHCVLFGLPPPLESSRQFVRRIIAGGIPQFVVLLGDRVVGWCDILPIKMEGFTHSGELGMGVCRDCCQQGIGLRLLHSAIAAAQEISLERVELEVFASNTPAVRLYQSEGFLLECVKVNARFLDSVYDDLLVMAKFI